MPDQTLRYHYDLTLHAPGSSAEFSLWSEVGEPYKARLQAVIDANQLSVTHGTELDCAPWCADRPASPTVKET